MTKENSCPMRREEIGKRRNRTKSQCCIVNAEQLQNLKWKAYETEMETSGLKDWWRSKTDQDEKGETRRMHLRMERSSI